MLILYCEKKSTGLSLNIGCLVCRLSDISVSQVSNCRLQAPLNTQHTVDVVHYSFVMHVNPYFMYCSSCFHRFVAHRPLVFAVNINPLCVEIPVDVEGSSSV